MIKPGDTTTYVTTREGVLQMNDKHRSWFVYSCPPQDFWHGWTRLEDALLALGKQGDIVTMKQLMVLMVDAAEAIRSHDSGWEGDARDNQWWISGLPTGDSNTELIFAVKQDNNGQTFFASPFPLHWLPSEFACKPSH